MTELGEIELRDQFDRWTPVIIFLTDFGKYYRVLMKKIQAVKHPIIHKVGEWHCDFMSVFYQAFFSSARYELPTRGPEPVTMTPTTVTFRNWRTSPPTWYLDRRVNPPVLRCSVCQLADQCMYTTLCMSVLAVSSDLHQAESTKVLQGKWQSLIPHIGAHCKSQQYQSVTVTTCISIGFHDPSPCLAPLRRLEPVQGLKTFGFIEGDTAELKKVIAASALDDSPCVFVFVYNGGKACSLAIQQTGDSFVFSDSHAHWIAPEARDNTSSHKRYHGSCLLVGRLVSNAHQVMPTNCPHHMH